MNLKNIQAAQHYKGKLPNQKMLNVTHYQRNANQNHNEVPSHAGQNGCNQKVYKQQLLEKVGRRCRKGAVVPPLLMGIQTSKPLWRTVWRCLKKLEIELPYDPAIPLLGIHTEKTRIEETRVPQCSSQHCLQ